MSPAYKRVMRSVQEAAPIRSNVLITGEGEPAKELLHGRFTSKVPSMRSHFKSVDCATLPEGVMESELFGHVRGAFTGGTGG